MCFFTSIHKNKYGIESCWIGANEEDVCIYIFLLERIEVILPNFWVFFIKIEKKNRKPWKFYHTKKNLCYLYSNNFLH